MCDLGELLLTSAVHVNSLFQHIMIETRYPHRDYVHTQTYVRLLFANMCTYACSSVNTCTATAADFVLEAANVKLTVANGIRP